MLVDRLRGSRSVEVELDHLPVAFVRIREVVEDVEEPVLQREPSRPAGLGCDVRVQRRRPALRKPALPHFVVAPGSKRVAGEIEVVVEEPAPEPRGGRADGDHVVAAPGRSQSDRVDAEDRVHVDRTVGLAGPALVLLLDELHDRGKTLRQVLLRLE